MAKLHTVPPGAVSALEADEKHLVRPSYSFARFGWAMLGFSVMYMVMGFGVAVHELLVACHTGQAHDWDNFWNFGFVILRFSPFLLLTRKDVWETLDKTPERMRAARRSAREADDVVAPPAQPQPQLLDIAGTVNDDACELTLRRPRGTGRILMTLCGWMLVTFGTIPLLGGMFILVASFFAVGASGGSAASASVICGVALTGGGWLLVRQSKALARVVVHADAIGIAWRYGGMRRRWKHIEWSQALAFITLAHRSLSTYQRRDLYALDTPAGVLCWEERTQASWEKKAGDATTQRTSAYYLRRLIVSHTGLPMRDISAVLDAVDTEHEAEATKSALKLPLGPPGSQAHLPVDQLFVEPAPPLPTRPPRMVCAERFALAGLSVLTLLLYAGGWGLQHNQPRYYAGLLQTIHAQQPLYQNSLAFPSGDWPTEQPSAKNGNEAYFYADGAYHLKGSDSTSTVWAVGSPVFGDAAVEATVAQRGKSGSDGVGLVLRASDSGNDFVVYYIDSSGWWYLTRYHLAGSNPDDNWHDIDSAPSDAIHTGDGATNRLLVVLRGTSFLCYINGTFVGAVNDDASPRSGSMGVFVNDSSTEGIFSTFDVYTAPPQSFLF